MIKQLLFYRVSKYIIYRKLQQISNFIEVKFYSGKQKYPFCMKRRLRQRKYHFCIKRRLRQRTIFQRQPLYTTNKKINTQHKIGLSTLNFCCIFLLLFFPCIFDRRACRFSFLTNNFNRRISFIIVLQKLAETKWVEHVAFARVELTHKFDPA